MSQHELTGPETNLYGRPQKTGMSGLAGVGEHPRVLVEDQATAKHTELILDMPLQLDYGGDYDGQLFTYTPSKS